MSFQKDKSKDTRIEENLVISSNIAELRKRKGLTQLDLSHKVGVTETTIANWENNRKNLDIIYKLIKLCKALDCDIHQLIIHSTTEELQHREDIDVKKNKIKKSTWSVLNWIKNRRCPPSWCLPKRDTSGVIRKGNQPSLSELEVHFVKQIKIDKDDYELILTVSPKVVSESNFTCQFELNLANDKSIPKGIKLKILTSEMEDFNNNEVIADGRKKQIKIKLKLKSGEGITWRTDPLSKGFCMETLWF